MIHLTIDIEEKVLEEARKKATQQGTSIDELLLSYLDAYAGDQYREQREAIRDLIDLSLQFREDMAYASIIRAMEDRFRTTHFSPRISSFLGDRCLELTLAYSYAPRNETFVIEARHQLREEDLERMREIRREFRDFFPSPKAQKVYGILVAVEISDEMRERVLGEGIYLARTDEDEKEFRIDVPGDFKPRVF